MSFRRDYDCYNVEDVEEKLNKEIEEDRAILKAWEKVTFPTKKDGSPYRTMSKNFDGAKLAPVPYALHDGEMRLSVYTNENGKYYSDDIDCYAIVKYLEDEKKINKKENYMEKEPCFNQLYRYDLEDIKDAISKRIQYKKEQIENLEEEKKQAKKAFNEFQETIQKAYKKLADTTGSRRNSLYYLIEDTVLANKNY